MPHTAVLIGFALISLGIVLTPGPNMMYLISRAITQGPAAGLISLGSVKGSTRCRPRPSVPISSSFLSIGTMSCVRKTFLDKYSPSASPAE